MISSPTLSAKGINATMAWAVPEFIRLCKMYLKGAAQDGYLPLSEPPKNELEEMDLLQAELPQLQMILAQPPDPRIEAQRSQAQQKVQRLMSLRLKYAQPEEMYDDQDFA